MARAVLASLHRLSGLPGRVADPAAPRPGRAVLWLLVLGIFACAPARVQPPPAPPPPPAVEPTEPALSPPPPCERIVHIDVWKEERKVAARCARGAVVTWTAAMGRAPEGPKRRAGDMRTPVGEYRVAGAMLRSERFHGFIPIDYPSVADARAALAEGRISRADAERIVDAHEAGRLPPGDTPLGGEIGFHGEGDRWRGDSVDLDWTYGCIALPDDELEFLAERLEVGVPVVIHP